MLNVLAAFSPFAAPLWEPRILSIRFMTVARGRRIYEIRVQTGTYDLRARENLARANGDFSKVLSTFRSIGRRCS